MTALMDESCEKTFKALKTKCKDNRQIIDTVIRDGGKMHEAIAELKTELEALKNLVIHDRKEAKTEQSVSFYDDIKCVFCEYPDTVIVLDDNTHIKLSIDKALQLISDLRRTTCATEVRKGA